MEIEFYPYDFDYKVGSEVDSTAEGKTYIQLFGKLKDGRKLCVKQAYEPYFYACLGNLDKEQFEEKLRNLKIDDAKVASFKKVEREFLGEKKEFYKIFVNYPKAVPILAGELQSWGIKCYEKDVLFVHRYLRDNKIIPLSLVKAEGSFAEESEYMDGKSVFMDDKSMPMDDKLVFLADRVVQDEIKPSEEWKILAIDIETYSPNKELNAGKYPILMIALYGKDSLHGKEFKKVITWKKFNHNLDYLEVVADEKEMLEKFKEAVLEYAPEIICGYFSDGCDFPYLRTRADKHGVKFDLGRDGSELIVGRNDCKIKGMLHLDVFKFIRNIFGMNLKAESYSLDAVSEELLGHRKHKVNIMDLAGIWDRGSDELESFCEYNLHDADLTYELCSKLLPDMIEFTKIIGLPAFDVIRLSFSRLVESYIMKNAVEQEVIAPNKPGNDEISRRMEESIQGAYVFEPTPGLYDDIIVFDFRSLYPSIISAHNIGPESLNCECCRNKPHVPGKEEYWFCREKKFIPSLLENLITIRVELKKQIKQASPEDKNSPENKKILSARSYALKILANSFYGYLGFYAARWYCLECAASTTAYARNYIKETIKKAEETGFRVIYADTDSCFLLLGKKSLEEAMGFMEEINSNLPGQMELEFEGYFPKGIFVALKSTRSAEIGAGRSTGRGAEKGAKKKYALLTEKGSIKITGFESVRRNWSPLAKEVQREIITLILNGKKDEALKYAKEIVAGLKAGKIKLEKLILKTQITRELSYYTSIGPHVKVAHEMVKKGEPVGAGAVIRYVIVKGSGLVRERAKMPEEVSEGGYDPDYYIKHQLIPAVSSIFAVIGYSEEEIFAESRQVGLGKFFK